MMKIFKALMICAWVLLTVLALGSYRVKQGDTLTVKYILGAENVTSTMSGEFVLQVPPGGMITLPYTGDIQTVGRTVMEIQEEVTTKLRKRFPLAESFVIISKIYEEFFSIIGEVEMGGQMTLRPEMTLREAVASAGALTQRPELLRAVLFRDGKVYKEFDLYAISAQDDNTGAEKLRPGDVISIQTKRQFRIWTSGMTAKPGSATYEQGTTLQQITADIARPGNEKREQVWVSVIRGGSIVKRANLFDLDSGKEPVFMLEDGDFVSISPEETYRVWVFGEVSRPGQYDIPAGSNILQAISASGGANNVGSLRNVRVMRGDNTQIHNLYVYQDKPNETPKNEPGDIIIVSENVRKVAVFGEVNRPGVFTMNDTADTKLSDAIGYAGGLTKRGPANRVSIIRLNENNEAEMIPVDFSKYLNHADANFNPIIKEGDVVMVGETPRIEFRDVMNALIAIFGFRNIVR